MTQPRPTRRRIRLKRDSAHVGRVLDPARLRTCSLDALVPGRLAAATTMLQGVYAPGWVPALRSEERWTWMQRRAPSGGIVVLEFLNALMGHLSAVSTERDADGWLVVDMEPDLATGGTLVHARGELDERMDRSLRKALKGAAATRIDRDGRHDLPGPG